MRLYRHLGIPLRRNDFTFSFSALSAKAPYLLYNGQNGLRGMSIPTSQRSKLSHRYLLASCRTLLGYGHFISILLVSYVCLLAMALYHHVCGHLLDPQHRLSKEPLRVWAARHSRTIHPIFLSSALLPLFSAVATASHSAVMDMPVAEMLLYVATTFSQSHVAVQGGVCQVQDALTKHIDPSHIHLNANVSRIDTCDEGKSGSDTKRRRQAHRRSVSLVIGDDEVQHSGFHHVILATPAPFSAALLQTYGGSFRQNSHGAEASDQRGSKDAPVELDATQAQLRNVQYESSTVVTHTDQSFLPADRRDHRDLNLVAPVDVDSEPNDSNDHFSHRTDNKIDSPFTMATHAFKASYSASHEITATSDNPAERTFVMQTTNPTHWPAKESTLRISVFQRAMTPASKDDIDGLFIWERTPTRSVFQVLAEGTRDGLLRCFSGPWSAQRHQKACSSLLQARGDWISEVVARLSTDIFRRPELWKLHLGKLQAAQTTVAGAHGSGEASAMPAVEPAFWVCGSYAQGIPLLEGCVTSSALVVSAILRAEQLAS